MKNLITGLFSLVCVFTSSAQYCEPVASCVDGDMINSFTFNTISNLSSGCGNTSTGYTNTGISTSVSMGNSYNLTIQSGSAWQQGFGIWIDYNQDEDFDDSDEFVYSSNGSSTDQFTGSITIPNTATSGTTRMRVRSQYGSFFSSSESCSNVGYGETEDYSITIAPSNIPPTADFTVNTTSTCSGTVIFSDLSNYSPTGWLWYFGDGSTSTQQNPTHTYSTDGSFTVSLVATNQFGSDSVAFENYVNVNLSAGLPVAATCTPTTINAAGGFGITNFQFNTINNNSANGSAGYEDFTCFATTVLTGKYYDISITTDQPAPHNVKVWIDFNNNGSFSNSELVLEKSNTLITTDSILIPDIAVTDVSLRMRVMADFYQQAPPEPCNDLQNGQAEDYTIIIEENTLPPVAAFSQSVELTCDGNVTFSDLSDNVPTFWFWDFGDGNTSTQSDPTHTYTTSGTYDVMLIASNSFGSDTITKTETITVNFDGQVVDATCSPTTTSPFGTYGIYGVYLNEINNATSGGYDLYQDYSCQYNTVLGKDGCYEITIRTGPDNGEDVRAWLDFNNDGSFTDTELVFESYNGFLHTGKITIPETGVVLDTPLRLRVSSDLVGNDKGPCDNVQWGQVEDYAVTIASVNPPPTVFFSANQTETCDGYIQFTDESCGSPTSWLWNFGDGTTSTEQNPLHKYEDPGTYNVTLNATNSLGTSSATINNYINVSSSFGVPTDIQCKPATSSPFQDIGILRVRFYSIDHSTDGGVDSYEDYTCEQQTILTAGQNVPIQVYTSENWPEDVYVWIDANNDGFLGLNEQFFSSLNQYGLHSGSISIPQSIVTNVPLRMRVFSDYSQGFSVHSCTEPQYGQVEDYTIIVQDQNSVPIASFSADSTEICLGTVQFYNYSSSNAQSFAWNFGDGTTSTSSSPSHTYSSYGTYTVKLTATNSNGSDIMTRTNYIKYTDCALIGIDDPEETLVDLYPNPTNGILNINVDNESNETYTIAIYNLIGEIIYQEQFYGNYQSVIDLSVHNKGMYLVRIIGETETITKKIIVE